MDIGALLEGDLELAVARAAGEACPPRLAEALRYAVFPGGARIRPRLTLAVCQRMWQQKPIRSHRFCIRNRASALRLPRP
jgi:geranylgeranyl diphosphate synthase, type II